MHLVEHVHLVEYDCLKYANYFCLSENCLDPTTIQFIPLKGSSGRVLTNSLETNKTAVCCCFYFIYISKSIPHKFKILTSWDWHVACLASNSISAMIINLTNLNKIFSKPNSTGEIRKGIQSKVSKSSLFNVGLYNNLKGCFKS